MKKTLIKIFACFAVLCMTVVSAYALSSASCTLNKGTKSTKTSSIGQGLKSTINVSQYSDSGNTVNYYHFCGWVGWPYTVEYSNFLAPKDAPIKHTETQSKKSNFYLQLENKGYGNTAHAKGTISLN